MMFPEYPSHLGHWLPLSEWLATAKLSWGPIINLTIHMSFDPFDSFAHIGKAFAKRGPIYAAHAELGKFQAQINGALASQRTIVAERRVDLSYRANRILSQARFLRVLEVRLHPGHQVESNRIGTNLHFSDSSRHNCACFREQATAQVTRHRAKRKKSVHDVVMLTDASEYRP